MGNESVPVSALPKGWSGSGARQRPYTAGPTSASAAVPGGGSRSRSPVGSGGAARAHSPTGAQNRQHVSASSSSSPMPGGGGGEEGVNDGAGGGGATPAAVPYRGITRNSKPVTKDVLVPFEDKAGKGLPRQYWLYSSFEYKMTIREDQALQLCCRRIDALCEKLQKLEARGHLVFDIVATRKQIERGGPLYLGREVYRFVEEKYFATVSTTFVGLTDNYARRVGRDIYCRSEELSPKKYDFDCIDNERMFIVYPA